MRFSFFTSALRISERITRFFGRIMLSAENNPSSPRNVDDCTDPAAKPERCDVAKKRQPSIEEKLASKMFSYSTEIISLFVVITLTFGLTTIHNPPPRISKPPSAKPFFNESSVVLDFYKGHLEAMISRASDADLSFIMYYAPWDAESQALRNEFENVAQHYYSKIYFAAINCWHPGSQCRIQYNKIQSYPVLILYPSPDTAIEYRGIKTAPYMIRFLDSFIRPINRITKREDLSQLLVESDAVVVGFINFKGLPNCPGYKEFYRAATRFLQRDPNRDVTFAIVTNADTAAKEFGIFSLPSATITMWNETLIFSPEKSWASQNLINWIDSSLHKVALWLQPPGVKSLTLAPYMRDGPVLLLFTPRNPYHLTNYNYQLLKEIALQYYSCDDILLTDNLVERLRENIRQGSARHDEESKNCVKMFNNDEHQSNAPAVKSSAVQQWINNSCCAKIVMNKCLLCKKTFGSYFNIKTDVCSASKNHLRGICKGSDIFRPKENQDDSEHQQFCCDSESSSNSNDRKESIVPPRNSQKSLNPTSENDPRSTYGVRTSSAIDKCTKLLAGNKYYHPIFPAETEKSNEVKVTVSACKVNKTLALIAIDSLQYFQFAEGLGIDILKMRDKTAVVILDAEQESQYLMKRPYSRESLVEFINKYTDGLLRRTLRSESFKSSAGDSKSKKGCDDDTKKKICVPELTADTFLKVVMDPTKDVVVMYHSPYCAFCSTIAYVYLTVAKYLSKMDHLIFVRIDGDNNDLPWAYTMDRYPSILFFPGKRKEDSTVYPYSLPLTVPNLMNFVLANLEGDSHVEALVNICSLGSGEPPKDCVARTRRLCLDVIEKLLRNYRKLGRNVGVLSKKTAGKLRREILLKLEHIREIHLILDSVDNLGTDDAKLQKIRRRFKDYYRNLVTFGKRGDRKGSLVIKNTVANCKIIRENGNTVKDEL